MREISVPSDSSLSDVGRRGAFLFPNDDTRTIYLVRYQNDDTRNTVIVTVNVNDFHRDLERSETGADVVTREAIV